MRYNVKNYSGFENRILNQWMSAEAKEWSEEFVWSENMKSILDILKELNSKLPPGEKFKPSVKKEKYPDRFRLYTGYNNLAVAPAEKRDARNKALFTPEDLEKTEENLRLILGKEGLQFHHSYWIPTEKFEIVIFNPFLPIEDAI
jgi:hypothetical protein